MNYWRQTNHIMSYFKEETFRGAKRLPSNFMTGFLEVSPNAILYAHFRFSDDSRVAIKMGISRPIEPQLYICYQNLQMQALGHSTVSRQTPFLCCVLPVEAIMTSYL